MDEGLAQHGELRAVAVKCLRLENITSSLEEIQTEVRAMKMNKHPNVLELYCCFVVGSELWMIMPLMNKGSCYYAMKKLRAPLAPARPAAFSEDMIAIILHDLLQGLRYVHENHQIHRDIKAGNLLVGQDCLVKIADFGVAGWFEKPDALSRASKARAAVAAAAGSEGGPSGGGGSSSSGAVEDSRTTFVGTPCWMAPEVMQSHRSNKAYNEKVDLWSVGITALELAKGHAPYSKLSPISVIVKTIEEPAPSLASYEGPRAPFSEAFSKFVARCLHKDAKLRPSAAELLSDPLFSGMEAFDLRDPRRLALWELLSPLDVVKEARGKAEGRLRGGGAGSAAGGGGGAAGGGGAGAGSSSSSSSSSASGECGEDGAAGGSGAASQVGWTDAVPGTTWDFGSSASEKLAQLDPSLIATGSVNVPATLLEGDEEENAEDDAEGRIAEMGEFFKQMGGEGEEGGEGEGGEI